MLRGLFDYGLQVATRFIASPYRVASQPARSMPLPVFLSETSLYEYADQQPQKFAEMRQTATSVTLHWTMPDCPHRAFQLLAEFQRLDELIFKPAIHTELPCFSLPPRLRRLQLEQFHLHQLDEAFWQQATELEELILHAAVPQPLRLPAACLPKLRYLEIKMRLEAWPDALFDITSLKELVLNFNALKEIPERIANLTQLEKLFLRKNAIQTINPILSLTQLKELDLTGNPLGELPEGIELLRSLERLELSSTRLSHLPDNFAQLQQLHYLDLSFNKLTHFPTPILSLTQLQELKLENNRIESLPENIAQLMQLRQFNLKNNPLLALPPALVQLYHLERLDLSMDRSLQTRFFNDTDAVFYLPNINNVHIFGGEIRGRNMSLTQAFIKAIYHKLHPDRATVKQLIPIYFQDEKGIAEVPNSIFTYVLSVGIKFPEAALWCIEQLLQRTEARARKTPIAAGARVAIVGRSNLRTEHLIAQLEGLGIAATTQADEATTHIVLCLGTEINDRHFYDKENIVFLTEQQLIAFLDSQDLLYLKQAATTETAMEEGMAAHIQALLSGDDEANAAVAFELMHSGGVPPVVLEDLFLLAHYSRFSSIQKQANDLLLAYGSERLKHNLLHKKNIKRQSTFLLKDLVEGTELVWWKILRFLILNNKIESACRAIPDNFFQETLQLFPDDATRRDFLAQWVAKRIHNNPKGYRILHIFNIAYIVDFETILPHIETHSELRGLAIGSNIQGLEKTLKGYLHRHPELQLLDIDTEESLDWQGLFPPQAQLHHLRLRPAQHAVGDFNYQFVQQLSQLTELSLWLKSPSASEIPPFIFELTQLTSLEIYDHFQQGIPIDWQAFRFPELRELHLNHALIHFDEIPDVLAGMPLLEDLSLVVKLSASGHYQAFIDWKQALEDSLRQQNWQGRLDVSRTW